MTGTPRDRRLFAKGAPEVLLERATHILDDGEVRPIVDADRHVTLAAYHNMAARGLRTLAVARRDLPADLWHDHCVFRQVCGECSFLCCVV